MMHAFRDALRNIRARLTSRRFAVLAALALVLPAVCALVFVAAISPSLDARSRIPVAVVNLDQGTEGSGGESINYGEELVESLEDSGELAWSAMDEDTALEGLGSGAYALIVKIPADYSERVASLDGSSPQRAQLQIISSGSENILATREGSAALKQVQTKLRADLGEDYLLRVLNGVSGQASSLTLTADGAVMLDEAYDALEQGTDTIATTLDQTAQGADALAEGIDGIAAGATAAGTGAQALADGMATTGEQLGALSEGAQGVSTGLDMVSSQLGTIGSGVYAMGGELQTLAGTLRANAEELPAALELMPQIGAQTSALSEALSGMTGAREDVQAAGSALAQAAEGAQDSLDAVQEGSAALAQALTSEDAENPGAVQELRAIDERYDELQQELDALIEEAAAGSGAVEAVRLQELSDDLEELAERRAALIEQLEGSAADATELSEAATNAQTDLSSMPAAQEELDVALDSFDGSAAAANGAAEQLNTLVPQVAGPVSSSATSLVQAYMTLDALAPAVQGAGTGISTIADQLSSDGLIGQGAAGVATGTAAVPQAFATFSTATGQLAQGNIALGEAISLVGSGASSLGDGLSLLAGVQGQLADGVGALREGQQTVNDTLSVAGDTLAELSGNAEHRAEVAASPVSLETTTIDAVEGASSSFAPIALALVLWLGALGATYVLPLVERRAVLAGHLCSSVLTGFALTAAFCLVQALLAAAVLIVFAGVSLAGGAVCAGLLVLASISFAAVAQALRLACGSFAAAVSLAALFVQLLCAGAILPASFTGGVFAALGRVLPVPVLADALRGALAGSTAGLGGACIVLVVSLAAGLAASLVAVSRWRVVRPERTFAVG